MSLNKGWFWYSYSSQLTMVLIIIFQKICYLLYLYLDSTCIWNRIVKIVLIRYLSTFPPKQNPSARKWLGRHWGRMMMIIDPLKLWRILFHSIFQFCTWKWQYGSLFRYVYIVPLFYTFTTIDLVGLPRINCCLSICIKRQP